MALVVFFDKKLVGMLFIATNPKALPFQPVTINWWVNRERVQMETSPVHKQYQEFMRGLISQTNCEVSIVFKLRLTSGGTEFSDF